MTEEKEPQRHNGEEDHKVGIFHDKLKIIKQYGVIGVAVVTMPFWQPYLEDYLDKNTEIVVRLVVTEVVTPLKTSVDRLIDVVDNMEEVMTNIRGGVKALEARDIDYIARKAVGMQSIVKVKEIKRALQTYSRDTESQKIRLRKKIKEILVRNSSIYVKDLNRYQHRKIGKVGAYIWNEFPMSEFLLIINDLTVDSPKSNKITVMTDDVMIYMLEVQDSFFQEMYKKMNDGDCD